MPTPQKVPQMNPWPLDNSVLLFDNAVIHHCMDMEEILNEIGISFFALSFIFLTCRAGCVVLFLPPYSPDFNPIELTFHTSEFFCGLSILPLIWTFSSQGWVEKG
jgi:DDE superfamily endonuclease